MMRNLRVTTEVERSQEVTFFFGERSVRGHLGETIAAALYAEGIRVLRRAPRAKGEPRGVFCYMGLCQECVVEIGGRRTESCRARVSAGLQVTPLDEEVSR